MVTDFLKGSHFSCMQLQHDKTQTYKRKSLFKPRIKISTLIFNLNGGPRSRGVSKIVPYAKCRKIFEPQKLGERTGSRKTDDVQGLRGVYLMPPY